MWGQDLAGIRPLLSQMNCDDRSGERKRPSSCRDRGTGRVDAGALCLSSYGCAPDASRQPSRIVSPPGQVQSPRPSPHPPSVPTCRGGLPERALGSTQPGKASSDAIQCQPNGDQPQHNARVEQRQQEPEKGRAEWLRAIGEEAEGAIDAALQVIGRN